MGREEIREFFDTQVDQMIRLIDKQIEHMLNKFPGEQIVSEVHLADEECSLNRHHVSQMAIQAPHEVFEPTLHIFDPRYIICRELTIVAQICRIKVKLEALLSSLGRVPVFLFLIAEEAPSLVAIIFIYHRSWHFVRELTWKMPWPFLDHFRLWPNWHRVRNPYH